MGQEETCVTRPDSLTVHVRRPEWLLSKQEGVSLVRLLGVPAWISCISPLELQLEKKHLKIYPPGASRINLTKVVCALR